MNDENNQQADAEELDLDPTEHDADAGGPASEQSDSDDILDFEGTDVDRIAALEKQVEEEKRHAMIARADLENTRKRMRRDYEDQLKYAALPLIHDTLTVLDNLHRGLEACAGNEAAADLAAGMSMVAKQLEETLSKHGCTPIPDQGELFDPNYHEAISQMPSDEHPEGTVAQVAVRGYQLYDRVVRPSQVVVSTGPATTA